MDKPYFSGFYLDKYGSGIKSVDIYVDGPYINIWADDNLADDVDNDKDYFARNYGNQFYRSLDDFKADKVLSIDEVWPQMEKV